MVIDAGKGRYHRYRVKLFMRKARRTSSVACGAG